MSRVPRRLSGGVRQARHESGSWLSRGGKTYSGGLAGIDVADNDDVDVSLLLLTHFGGCEGFGLCESFESLLSEMLAINERCNTCKTKSSLDEG